MGIGYIGNVIKDYNDYELSLTDERSSYEKSIKNRLLPSIIEDLESIKQMISVDFIYNPENIYGYLNTNIGGAVKRFLAHLKVDIANEKDNRTLIEKVSLIERSRDLIDICHRDPNNNRVSNDIDYYIYKLNEDNENYRINRMKIKKELSKRLADTTSTYVSSMQNDIIVIAENYEPKTIGQGKGNAFVKNIPGRAGLYNKDE